MMAQMRQARGAGIGLGLALLAGLPMSTAPALAGGRALIIGVNDYPYLDNGDLNAAVGDARRMVPFVQAVWGLGPDDIRLLTDAAATGQAIRAAFHDWLVAGTQPGDPVILFFSGHGTQVPDNNGDEADALDEAIIPTDALRPGLPDAGILRDDELQQLLGLLADRQVTVIVDSCHSGTVTRQVPGLADPAGDGIASRFYPIHATRGFAPVQIETHAQEEPLLDRAAGDRLSVWSAASAHQYSWEDSSGGIFTTHFTDGVTRGLADANSNGRIANVELLDYVRGHTERWCQGVPQCVEHGFTPTFEGPAGAATATFAAAGAGTAPAADTAVSEPDAAAPEETDAGDALGGQNAANVDIAILPSAEVRLGQAVQFRVASDRGGYLILIDDNPAGQMIQLYPNRFAQERYYRVEPNRPVYIPDDFYPFEFAAVEPAGEGRVVAVVVEDQADIDEILGRHMDLAPIADRNLYLDRLARAMREITRDRPLARNRPIDWSVGTARYRITR